jgi:hypothetical protein
VTVAISESSRPRRIASQQGRRPKDPCCVLTSELAPIVQDFADRWTREHADLASKALAGVGGDRSKNELGHFQGNAVGAITILYERARLINGGRGGGRAVGHATIRNVLDRRTETTELWIADALLCAIRETGLLVPRVGADGHAMSHEDALALGVVRVIQNRHTALRCGCCG